MVYSEQGARPGASEPIGMRGGEGPDPDIKDMEDDYTEEAVARGVAEAVGPSPLLYVDIGKTSQHPSSTYRCILLGKKGSAASCETNMLGAAGSHDRKCIPGHADLNFYGTNGAKPLYVAHRHWESLEAPRLRRSSEALNTSNFAH